MKEVSNAKKLIIDNQVSPGKTNILLIGEILQRAGIVTQEQIDKALSHQKELSNIKLGEILFIQEDVNKKTIYFFLDKWETIRQKGHQFPIGYYLQQAFLLDNHQIKCILSEQEKNKHKFGDIAIAKGWIKQKTINFFLDNLSDYPAQLISLDALEKYDQEQLHLKFKCKNSTGLLSRILAWTKGHPSLTRNICKAISESDLNIPAGEEFKIVDQLVDFNLIRNWSTSDLGQHIRSIKGGIDNNQKCSSLSLWKEYREVILSDSRKYIKNKVQNELVNLGLITIKKNNCLKVQNLIISHIFNQNFIAEQINIQDKKIKISKILVKQETNLHKKSQIESQKEPNKYNKSTSLLQKNKNISGIILLSLFLILFTSFRKTNLLSFFQSSEIKTIKRLCEQIDIYDTESRLNNIFKLEKRKKELLNNSQEYPTVFPENCSETLDKMRMLAIPELGRDNNVIEALGFLCNVPENSYFITEAKVWLHRWNESPTWRKEVKYYLKEVDSCPAGKV